MYIWALVIGATSGYLLRVLFLPADQATFAHALAIGLGVTILAVFIVSPEVAGAAGAGAIFAAHLPKGNSSKPLGNPVDVGVNETRTPEAPIPTAQPDAWPADIISESSEDAELIGIKGWLLLPALNILLGIPALGWAVISAFPMVMLGGIYALEIGLHALVVGLAIYTAVRFFRKMSDAPKLYIVTLCAMVVVDIVMLTVIGLVDSTESEYYATTLIYSVAAAAIWVPYFLVSKRVKATFTNQGRFSNYALERPR